MKHCGWGCHLRCGLCLRLQSGLRSIYSKKRLPWVSLSVRRSLLRRLKQPRLACLLLLRIPTLRVLSVAKHLRKECKEGKIATPHSGWFYFGCGVKGHNEAKCWKLQPELKPTMSKGAKASGSEKDKETKATTR
jgi:hypothetical protein